MNSKEESYARMTESDPEEDEVEDEVEDDEDKVEYAVKQAVCDYTSLKAEDNGGYCKATFYLNEVHCFDCGIFFTDHGDDDTYKVGRRNPVMTCYNCGNG